MSIVTSVHLRTIRCHKIKKRHQLLLLFLKIFSELKKVFSLKGRNPPCDAFNWCGGWKAESWATELILRPWDLWQYLCTKTVCHRDNPFFWGRRDVQALIKALGRTVNQLSCVSWVSLHGCLLITPLAFSTFSEDWGLQEQCKWYSIPRIPWVTVALKVEHCCSEL